MGVIAPPSLSPINSGSSESVSFGPPIDAIQTGVKHFRPLKTVANEERIATPDLMVHLDIERVGIFHPDCGTLKIICKACDRRCRHETENPFGNGTDPVRRDDVTGKGLPARAIGIAGAWIINDLRRRQPQRRAQVTVAEIHRWNRRPGHIAAPIADRLIVSKEECFVLHDRPAERESVLVVNRVCLAGC